MPLSSSRAEVLFINGSFGPSASDNTINAHARRDEARSPNGEKSPGAAAIILTRKTLNIFLWAPPVWGGNGS